MKRITIDNQYVTDKTIQAWLAANPDNTQETFRDAAGNWYILNDELAAELKRHINHA